ALIEGAEVKEISTKNGRHDLESMLAAIDQRTKVVWICTPDNPTGTIISQEELDAFMEECTKDVIVVLDTAYDEFVDKEDRLQLHNNISKYNNMIVPHTFSKAYGLA